MSRESLRELLPFSNAHWLLPVGLWLSLAYVVFWEQCSEKPRYAGVILLTATIIIALWSNHIRERPLASWASGVRVVVGAALDLLKLLLWLLPLALVIPSYDCYTKRAKISELMALAPPLMAEIESRTKQHGSLTDSGVGLQVSKGRYLSGGIVSKDGTIIEVSKNPPAVIMLVPDYSAGTVTWKCTGFPKEDMPGDCRN